MSAILLNLAVNAAFSFLAGMLIVEAAIYFFRIPPGSPKLFLLALPFFKLLYDCLRGVPSDSALIMHIDPFLFPKGHQILSIGATWSYLGPVLKVMLSVQDLSGREFGTSIGDYLGGWLAHHLNANAPQYLLGLVAFVSISLFLRRLFAFCRFELIRKADLKKVFEHGPLDQTFASHFWQITTARPQWFRSRRVQIYESDFLSGSPFTGGLFKPYICIPSDARLLLSEAELKAVLAHELSHIRHFDLVLSLALEFLGDLFWFIPGYRAAGRKIDRVREFVADENAVASGADPVQLASALVKISALVACPPPSDSSSPTLRLSSSFISLFAPHSEASLLSQRVGQLLNSESPLRARFGWQNHYIRLVYAVWISFAVIMITFGGNHTTLVSGQPKPCEVARIIVATCDRFIG
jgi:Zn-dependent protease with chaperone function